MLEKKLYKEEDEVESRLYEFGATKDSLLKIIHAAAGGRNLAVANDPKTAGGQFAYIYGTRALRDVFLSLGWKKDRHDNIESVVNPDNGIKIIFQNVDIAADTLRAPKAISGKGAASARIIDFAQPNLFPEFNDEEEQKANQSVWFFCVSVNGDDVRAELSRPYSLEGGQFSDFIERIFILQNNDWEELNITIEDDTDLQDFEVNISRKQ
ncbi:MAG TPA: hypothetical protein PLE43_08315 [Alphaproteobacteria bacterium]|nr:hypothetical protein [Alphaproteobacteria bacterium]